MTNQLITYTLNYESNFDFEPLCKQYTDGVRLAYNRLLDGYTDKEIRELFKTEYTTLNLLKSFHVANIISEAKGLAKKYNSDSDSKPIVFGRKNNLIRLQKGLITKKEWKKLRLRDLSICGEKRYKGNRHFVLDIENEQIIFKQNRNNHHILNISGLSKKRKKELLKLQKSCSLKKDSFAISVSPTEIKIIFEPRKNKIKLFQDRYIGIDLNPDNIGISVVIDKKIVHVQEFNFQGLIKQITSLKKASNSKEVKYLNNKLNFETFQISKAISNLQKKWNCRFVFIEKLNFKQGNAGFGRRFNRLTKNLWKKDKFISNLTKRVQITGGSLFKIGAHYSSYIGNLKYNFTDAINASIEIGRRGYNVIIKKNKQFYPELTIDSLKDQWKDFLAEDVSSWVELSKKIKNSKLKYRVSFEKSKCDSIFHMNTVKSFVDLYLLKKKYLSTANIKLT